MLKILAISSLFPNPVQTRHGIFTRHRLAALAASHDVDAIKVLAPIPSFPAPRFAIGPYASLTNVPERLTLGQLDVRYPRYLNIPRVGMHVQPDLMARSLLAAARLLIDEGFDFDVVDAYYFYPDGVAAAILARELDKPLVITAYGNDLSLIAARSPRAARRIRASADLAGSNTAVCKALADALVGLGVAGEKVHVVLHGVDLKLFRPPAERSALRKKLRLNRMTLLCAGHLIERKGIRFAISALPDLPDMDLLIAGDGPEESSLRRLAARCNVEQRVRFLGHVDQRQLRDYLGAADIFVLMSSREGIANVIMESLACGTPVAGTAIWGTPEILCVPEAGRLVAERSADCLVATLQDLAENLPDRKKTRQYAESFTWEKTTSGHLRAVRQALDAQRA